MKYINCTPHPVVVYDEDGQNVLYTLEPSGVVPRVEEQVFARGQGPAFIATDLEISGGEDLPAPEGDTYYVVSRLVALCAARAYHETRFVVPTGFVRDDDGRILGCRGFGYYSEGY